MLDLETVHRVTATDEEIVGRVCQGDTALFEILMRRHNQRLYRVARAILKNDLEAEDVIQQAYVNAYTHLSQYSGQAAFATWLTRIAVHEALARARRRGRDVAIDVEPGAEQEARSMTASPEPSPEQTVLQTELRAIIESAIDALPIGYRSVFVFREVEGISTAETATCLGISEDAVKTRLHRARALLREDLLQRAGAATSEAFSFGFARCDRIVEGVLGRLASFEA